MPPTQARAATTLLTALLLAISSATATAQQLPPHPPAEKVILDTDIGDDIDDVFALGIALTSPELHILGITSGWGDTALRSRMIDRVLCETGRSVDQATGPNAIPVFTGVPTHRPDAASFSQAPWARAGIEHPHADAVAFILDQARKYPGQVTLIAIAPLTNIGAAIDRDPSAFRKLKRVVLMGGSLLRGYGEDAPAGTVAKPSAEYNIAMDPTAAQKLFTSGVPIFMMPLDSTQIDFDAQRRAALTTISTPLTDSIQVLTAEWTHETHRLNPTLFDPVAVAYAIDPATCPTTPEHVEVDDHGFTHITPGAPNAEACLEPHPEAFFNLITPRLMTQHLTGKTSCITPLR